MLLAHTGASLEGQERYKSVPAEKQEDGLVQAMKNIGSNSKVVSYLELNYDIHAVGIINTQIRNEKK